MTQKHTPAPWDDYGTTTIRDAKGILVAEVYELTDDKVTEANAHLIAAAPELLAALQDLQKQVLAHVKLDVRKHYSLMVAEAAASKAVNKATGETP